MKEGDGIGMAFGTGMFLVGGGVAGFCLKEIGLGVGGAVGGEGVAGDGDAGVVFLLFGLLDFDDAFEAIDFLLETIGVEFG